VKTSSEVPGASLQIENLFRGSLHVSKSKNKNKREEKRKKMKQNEESQRGRGALTLVLLTVFFCRVLATQGENN